MNTAVRQLQPMDPASLLDAQRRERDLAAARRGVDVVVIGGGVTGAGVALDAVTRGLSVALVERGDIANGTSRWSSKLVHGGLRYLAKGDVAVAWESAVERAVLAGRVAPHLIHALPQVFPDFEDERASAMLVRLGYLAGDTLRVAARTQRGLLPRARHVSAVEARELVPGLRADDLRGAVVGWDGQLDDDARFVLAIVRTAAAYGARVITRARVDEVRPQGGVTVTDEFSGASYDIPSTWVVNATGVWASELDPSISLHPSLGTHVVVPSAAVGGGSGSLSVQVPEHIGRFVFTLPQPDGITYIGLTDNEAQPDSLSEPKPPEEDIDWILSIVSTALTRPVTRADVIGAFAGVRPLVECLAGSSADISRRHLVQRTGALVTVTGGKLTTYRRMAEDTVDLISDAPCVTRDVALVGAGPRMRRPDVPDRLWRRYGTEAPAVWDLGAEDPSLRRPVADSSPVLGAELQFAIDAELALCPADLVHRRTRVGVLYDHADFAAAVEQRFGHELVLRDLDAAEHPQLA